MTNNLNASLKLKTKEVKCFDDEGLENFSVITAWACKACRKEHTRASDYCSACDPKLKRSCDTCGVKFRPQKLTSSTKCFNCRLSKREISNRTRGSICE